MQVKEKVIILKTTRYGDADLILKCLTPKGERISLFARSALRSKKRFGGGVLEPTHYVHVLYEDKGNTSRAESPLHTLKEASLIESFQGLRTDYSRIEVALHFVRLVSDVVREGDVESSDLFNLLGNTLRAAEKVSRLDWLRTQFEIKLLGNQGVFPVEETSERAVLNTPVSEVDKISLSDGEWIRLRGKIRRVMAEYVGHDLEVH